MTDIADIVSADALIIHDGFYPGINTNDIALLRLNRAVFPTRMYFFLPIYNSS